MIRLFFSLLNGAQPQRRWQFAVLTGLIVLSGFAELGTLGSLALFITSLSSPETIMQSKYIVMADRLLPVDILSSTKQFYLVLGVATVVLVVIKNIISACHTYAIARFDGALNVDYGCTILQGFLDQPYEWSSRQNSSDMLSLLGWRMYVGSFVTHIMGLICEGVVSLLLFTSLFILQPMVTLAVIGVLGALGGITFFMVKKRIFSLSLQIRELNLSVNKVSMKSVQGVKDVKLFNGGEESLSFFRQQQGSFVNKLAQQRVFERTTVWALETIGFGGLVVGTLVMFWVYDASSTSMMGVLSLLAVSAWRILPALYRSVAIFGYIEGYLPFLHKMQEMLKRIEDAKSERANEPEIELPPFSESIRFNNVGFQYAEASQAALSGIDLTILKGAFVGIVGHSGAGKSTFADILTGLITPTEGAVQIDDQPLVENSAGSWRKQVGFVPQSPYLFDGSVAENVAFIVDETRIDYERVAECISQAGLDECVAGLDGGLHASIGERGGLLSGGQAQRVAIARALYRNPEVLIFDEATSSLDDRTERLIRDTIMDLRGSRTIIVIAHRLKTVQDSDQVVWFEQGRLVDVGEPSDILPRYDSLNLECESPVSETEGDV